MSKLTTKNEKINTVIEALVRQGQYKDFDELLEKAREIVENDEISK